MSKIKFTYNKVYNYVKGKSVVDLIFEVLALRNTTTDSSNR